MYMKTNSNLDNSSDIFSGDEFVFTKNYKPDGTSEIIGGGYKVNSFFLQDGIPAMTTFNNSDLFNPAINSEQTGGKVSNLFENLAVPAGLFYINQKNTKNMIIFAYILQLFYKLHVLKPNASSFHSFFLLLPFQL